jgi:hypothetical protein
MEYLRDFLISFSSFVERNDSEGDDCPFMFVSTDRKHSYFGDDSTINKTGSNGESLIVLHAISPKGPLCERIDVIRVCDFLWNGDTPNPNDRDYGMSTCELLWKRSPLQGTTTTT